jgi:GATA-binding protein 4
MRKDGIQTRKRKPKKSGSGSDVMGLVKKEDGSMQHHHPGLHHLSHHHHDDLKANIDRNGNSKLMLTPGSPAAGAKLLPKSHITSPIHHHHHHHQSAYPMSPLSSMSVNSHASPNKYDSSASSSSAALTATSSSSSAVPHNHSASSHSLYTSPLIASSQGNLHNSYLHNSASAYGAIKSESNIPGITANPVIGGNYDYMSNCIQNGYFSGSFGTAAHSDLSGYHHQHNVIHTAKLMAST